MLYNSLKILHIISATLLLLGIVISVRLWKISIQTFPQHIQTQTTFIIVPLSLFQLATGFTMISLKHYDLSERWIAESVTGFIILMSCWFGALLLNKYHRTQGILLGICIISILYMIFLMANRIL